jgi:hypothetical protein
METLSLIARIQAQFASCAAVRRPPPACLVRPWTVIISAPAFSSARASATVRGTSSKQRILTTVATRGPDDAALCASTARRMAAMQRVARARSSMRKAPEPFFLAHRWGQPIFSSTASQNGATSAAAAASDSGSDPPSWVVSGLSSLPPVKANSFRYLSDAT